MSYIAYINGHQLELLVSSPIAYTKQVNDIARLDNRQSNFTHKFIVPFTANNKKAMEFVYMLGNESNLPYKKNEFNLFDTDNGICLIYKGWAVLAKTTDKGYEINVYDGIIDFYRAIENKTLTDVDITGLNHTKNIESVINSFTQDLPYKYIIADYNGKNTDTIGTPPNGEFLNINIDYQVPSAKVSFIWNRIFEHFGYTYNGSVFQSEKFINFYMTFPKPVPTLVPIVELVTSQTSEINCNLQQQPDFSYIYICNANLFPVPIGNLPTGTYRIKCEGLLYTSYNGSPLTPAPLISYYFGTQNGTINSELSEEIIVTINSGDLFWLQPPYYATDGSVVTTIERVLGYDANFSEALIDFKVTEFVNEIVQHFGLTMFKDKHSNNIDFLTIKELLKDAEVEDWSDRNPILKSEQYVYGNYAKKNLFKYRYNDENDTHNDGFISINNENLKEEQPVINSKIYSPMKGSAFIGSCTEVFKFWNKELKDNGEIEYKELNDRYYFIRFQNISTIGIKIGSKVLNQYQEINSLSVANYNRLNLQDVITDNYNEISSILNKSKILEVDFYLNSQQVSNFDFKKLVYVEQYSSYFIVNKIINFIKNKYTKCELIKVNKIVDTVMPPPFEYFIQITNSDVVDCQLILDVETNITQPANVTVTMGIIIMGGGQEGLPPISSVVENNQIIIPLSEIPPSGTFFSYTIFVNYQDITPEYININSNTVQQQILEGCYPTPPVCGITGITIEAVQRIDVGSPDPALNNRSAWYFTKNLIGINSFPDFFGNPMYDTSSCRPYSYKYELNSPLGYQTETIPIGTITDYVTWSWVTQGRPNSATLKVTLIKSDGTELESNIVNF